MVSDALRKCKVNAALRALELVGDLRVIGVGTGSTVYEFIKIIPRIRSFETKTFVPSSIDTAVKLSSLGVNVAWPGSIDRVDVYVDGLDEVDGKLNMIKGRGGALTMEKILAYHSDKRIFICDHTKLVAKLGSTKPVPIEVVPGALRMVMRKLVGMGYRVEFRMGSGKDGPTISDLGGVIVDVYTGSIKDPEDLEKTFRSIPGIIETGLFVNIADIVVVGYPDRVVELRRT